MGTIEPPNPYQAPRAAPEIPPPTAAMTASLEDAIAGRYQFTIGGVMDEAWQLVKGMKASFWGAAVLIGVIYMVAGAMVGLVAGLFGAEDNMILRGVLNALVAVLMAPLTMGLQMMCVRRARGLPISFSTAFDYFHRAVPAVIASILVMLLGYLGLLLLIIPGIYLFIAYNLTTQLIADRELGAWQAMETSRKAITHRWFRVFGLIIVVALLTGLSALLLFIPLIWTVPWSMMTAGVLYRRIFYANAP